MFKFIYSLLPKVYANSSGGGRRSAPTYDGSMPAAQWNQMLRTGNLGSR